ncbi:MAG: hypothetical protein U0271_08780 [Polyangiaceae bacterium]
MARSAGASTILLLSLLGCSGDPAPAPLEPVRFDMTVSVAPGEELLACQFVRMPADESFVSGGSYATSDGTHHFLLFRTAPDMPEQELGRVVDCNEGEGLMRYERGYVSGGQLPEDDGDFPTGLALAFAPDEVLLMQMHVLNSSQATVEASASIELRRVAAEQVTARVGTLRFYNPFIYVPAGGASRAAMRCPTGPTDITLLTAGAHMHARGVAYRAYADIAGEPRATEPFYSTTEWQHPDYYAGLLPLPAGSDLRFECDYENSEARDVVQGRTAADEMCMLSAFYYPAQDYDTEICARMDEHGTQDRNCAQTLSCIQLCSPDDLPRFDEGDATVGACFQKCIVESCPNVSGALFPELLCSQAHCQDACATFGAACSQCVAAQCKAELDACQALACDGQ